MDTVSGDACLDSQFDEGKTTVRSFTGGLDDDGTSRGECGGDLSGDHGGREVPGCNDATDPHGLFESEDGCVGERRGDDIAVYAGCFFAEPLNEGCGVNNFALCLGKCLSVLQ